MTKRKYKFFAHFNRINMQRGNPNIWTVHYRGQCIQTKGINFRVPVLTKYKPDGRQPRAVLEGYANQCYNDGNYCILRNV